MVGGKIMKIDMWLFNRICEITKQDYEAGKSDDEESAMLYKDIDNILYDLVEEYDVLEEKCKDYNSNSGIYDYSNYRRSIYILCARRP